MECGLDIGLIDTQWRGPICRMVPEVVQNFSDDLRFEMTILEWSGAVEWW